MKTFKVILNVVMVVAVIVTAATLLVLRVVGDFRSASAERTTQQQLMSEGVQLVQKAAAAFGKLERENQELRAELAFERQHVAAQARQIKADRQNAFAWKRYCEGLKRQHSAALSNMRWFRNAYSDQSERFEARVLLLEEFIEENTCLPVPAGEASEIPTLAPPEVR